MGISENNLLSKDQSAVLGTSLAIEIKNKTGENLLGTDKFPIADIFVKYNRMIYKLYKQQRIVYC